MATGIDDPVVTTDLNTLLTALYVKIDDWLGRPRRTGRPPKLTEAELLTMAVAQVLLGVYSEARWLRFLPVHLPGAFPYQPGQFGTTSGCGRQCRCSSERSGPLLPTSTCGLTAPGGGLHAGLFRPLSWGFRS